MKAIHNDVNYIQFLALIRQHHANMRAVVIEQNKATKLEHKINNSNYPPYKVAELRIEYHKALGKMAQAKYYSYKSLNELNDFVRQNKKYKKLCKKLLTNECLYDII